MTAQLAYVYISSVGEFNLFGPLLTLCSLFWVTEKGPLHEWDWLTYMFCELQWIWRLQRPQGIWHQMIYKGLINNSNM